MLATTDQLVSCRRAISADQVERARYDVLTYESEQVVREVRTHRRGRTPTRRIFYVTYEEYFDVDKPEPDTPVPAELKAA